MNLSRLTDWLIVGQTPENEADLEQLFREGVTAIINCRIENDDAPLLDSFVEFKFPYLWDGVPDWTDQVPLGKQPLPLSFFQKARDFFPPLPRDNDECVLSHCTMGFNRSMVLAYFFLRASGMTADAAIALLVEERPIGGLWNLEMDIEWRKDAEAALAAMGYK